jgi:hypothetical protein
VKVVITKAFIFWGVSSIIVAFGLCYLLQGKKHFLINLPIYLVPILVLTEAGVWRSNSKKRNPFLGGFYGMLWGIFFLAVLFGVSFLGVSLSP